MTLFFISTIPLITLDKQVNIELRKLCLLGVMFGALLCMAQGPGHKNKMDPKYLESYEI